MDRLRILQTFSALSFARRSTLLAIFIAMLVNNQRMTDLRTDVGRRIDDLGAVLRAEMRADRLETNGKLDAILSMMAGMDQRVTKLEERPR